MEGVSKRNQRKSQVDELTDITAWWKVGNISGWFGAVRVSLPGGWADAPTSVGLVYSGASIFTVGRLEALWWPIDRWLSSFAVISCNQIQSL